MKTLKRRFIRCSAQATITHLKKFIAKKVLNGTEKYRDVSLTVCGIYIITVLLMSLGWCLYVFAKAVLHKLSESMNPFYSKTSCTHFLS
jgi:hypothetical protein